MTTTAISALTSVQNLDASHSGDLACQDLNIETYEKCMHEHSQEVGVAMSARVIPSQALELMVMRDAITGQEGNSAFAQKCANELTEQNKGANAPVTPVNLRYVLELSSYRRKESD